MDTPVLHIVMDDTGTPRTINGWVKVKMIVQNRIFANASLEDIADHYGIHLSDVHAAMAYYYDNQAVMDAQFEEDEELTRRYGVSGEELKARILKRMQEKNAKE